MAFIAWYGDPEVARLIRHDRLALSPTESLSYFQDQLLTGSAAGHSFAIVETATDRLIGNCSLTDFTFDGTEAVLRILIGPHSCWGKGLGTAAVRLLMQLAFERLGLSVVRLSVFTDNPRAVRSYEKIGFRVVARYPLEGPQHPPGAEELTMMLDVAAWKAHL